MNLRVALLLLSCNFLVIPLGAWSVKRVRNVAAGMIATTLAIYPMNPPVVAAEPAATVTSDVAEMDFTAFISNLEAGKIDRVTFKGINPKYLVVHVKDSDKQIEVRDGFPSFEDPLSPSGPTQVLAKVKATPGVSWEFDVSELTTARNTVKAWIRKKL